MSTDFFTEKWKSKMTIRFGVQELNFILRAHFIKYYLFIDFLACFAKRTKNKVTAKRTKAD